MTSVYRHEFSSLFPNSLFNFEERELDGVKGEKARVWGWGQTGGRS